MSDNSNSAIADPSQLLNMLQQRMIQMEQQFTQTVNTQQQHIVNLETELREQKQATNNLSSPGSNSNNNNYGYNSNSSTSSYVTTFKVDITKPTIWYGNNKDDKSSAPMWLLEVENYFEAVRLAADPVVQRISVVSTLLRGNALQWWQRVDKTAITTWALFKQCFLNEYEPKEVSEIARSKLDTLRQRGTVIHYCNDFREQMNKITDMALADQLHNFKKGLQPDIAREIAMQRPETLEKAIQLAQRVDLEMQHANRNYNRFNSHSGNNNNSSHRNNTSNNFRNKKPFYGNHNYSSSSNNTSAPMELGNTRARNISTQQEEEDHHSYEQHTNNNHNHYNEEDEDSDRNNNYAQELHYTNNNSNNSYKRTDNYVSNISKEEVRRRMAAGLCIRCKQKGHFANDCPFNKQSNISNNNSKK